MEVLHPQNLRPEGRIARVPYSTVPWGASGIPAVICLEINSDCLTYTETMEVFGHVDHEGLIWACRVDFLLRAPQTQYA